MSTEADTTGSGHFVISLLQPGTYTVTVTASSFAGLTQKNVVVDALTVSPFNPKLSVGTARQTLTVTSEPPMLQSGKT